MVKSVYYISSQIKVLDTENFQLIKKKKKIYKQDTYYDLNKKVWNFDEVLDLRSDNQ